MNRKYDYNKLSSIINVRLNEPERLQLKRIAEQLQTTRSRLLRKLVREVIGEGPDLLPQEMRVMNDAEYQVGCVGRNLNQLLKVIHEGRLATTPTQLALIKQLMERVDELHQGLDQVIERSRRR